MTRKLIGISFCLQIVLWLSSSSSAANKPKADSATADGVQKLLQSETSSESASLNRRDVLDPAARDSTAETVWWQSGYTRSEKQWVQYERSVAAGPNANLLDDYIEHRDAFLKRPHGQVQLAEWCHTNGLLDEERVHLLNALAERDSTLNVEQAYRRLGCKQVDGVWISPQERRDTAQRISEIEHSHRKWGSKLELLGQRLDGGSHQRAQAEKQLAAITDVSAVPAIVDVLCMTSAASAASAEVGLKTLGQISDYQASQALAGQAVFSPWRPIRVKAVEFLAQRRMEEYVPDLLMLLSEPIKTRVVFREADANRSFQLAVNDIKFAAIDDPRINWDYVWMDETRDAVRMGIRRLLPYSLPAGTRQEVSIRHPGTARLLLNNAQMMGVISQLIEQKEMLDDTADRINDARKDVNERVGKILSKCSDQPDTLSVKEWWKWWSTYSSVEDPKQKSVVVVDERPTQQPLIVPVLSASCLVAGTPIWTERGFVAIEQIQPGDRVLSKDISSGELEYKPVLRTTERAPTPVHKFRVGNEAIAASLGHHFWVSGDGWTKMRKLNAEMPLHTVTGMQRISAIEDEGQVEKVYNLVVADFHTYFVGKSMILSHDVQTPSLTNVKVPGLGPQ